ncbi:MAG TPA: NAD-dependent epimerase/dehydratase family protein [Dyella sp.]|uniref:NAD-dependent epimerase/dehydratase family protein n=1 Tax=Dyella sp. TaxID=1869338 RepID=UPI002CF114E1|nr:NAD-dependent epimerase/dehydratase family protein [Dyella sp.]HTV86781.1 NAD-dependent epimerase/dehydratase family protein [Dyella sp.]
MSERVLMAGCGDLGQRVAALLLARGDEVYALRRNPPAQGGSPVQWLRADLTRAQSIPELAAPITQLVYLPAPDAREEQAYRAVFVAALGHLLRVLHGHPLKRVLFVSSSAVYGEHGSDWIDEDTPPAPLGFNGRVLLEAEHLLSGQAVPSIVLRLAGLYGPGRLQLLERLRAGSACAPRTPAHWANRIHVDDAAAAIAHLLHLREPQALYLGVDDTPLPLHQLYGELAERIGAPAVPDGPAPPSIGSKKLSNARLRASGFRLQWPDARQGYASFLDAD